MLRNHIGNACVGSNPAGRELFLQSTKFLKDASGFSDSPFSSFQTFFFCSVPSSKRDEPPRRVEILRRTSLARREFPPATVAKTRERSFCRDRSMPTPSRRLAAAQPHFPHNFTFQLSSLQGTTRAATRRARAVDAEPARAARGRATPARRRARSRFSFLSRR